MGPGSEGWINVAPETENAVPTLPRATALPQTQTSQEVYPFGRLFARYPLTCAVLCSVVPMALGWGLGWLL